jgi:hypothetical protein
MKSSAAASPKSTPESVANRPNAISVVRQLPPQVLIRKAS